MHTQHSLPLSNAPGRRRLAPLPPAAAPHVPDGVSQDCGPCGWLLRNSLSNPRPSG